MKRKNKIYAGMLCALFFLGTGCDKEPSVTSGAEEKVPINLSASSLPVPATLQTRAETLNGRTIGVVAVKTDESTPLKDIDWSGYYLDHVRATGTKNEVDNEEEVVFAQPQWWPFNPGEYLAFAAYSPHYGNGGDERVTRVGTTSTLKVVAGSKNAFPDFLFTNPVGPYNKRDAQAKQSGVLSLGEFQHAMAKLDINVVLVDKNGVPIPKEKFPNPNPLRIKKLEVGTKVKNGEFNVTQTALPKQWTALDNSGTEQAVYTPVNISTELTASFPTMSCLLLPGTHDTSYIAITIEELDATKKIMTTIDRKAAISEFMDESQDPAKGAVLEMGKTTLLTIKVRYVSIPDPDPKDQIILEGQLVEWDYKGKITVVVE